MSAARHWGTLCKRLPAFYMFFLLVVSGPSRCCDGLVASTKPAYGLEKCTWQGFVLKFSASRPLLRETQTSDSLKTQVCTCSNYHSTLLPPPLLMTLLPPPPARPPSPPPPPPPPLPPPPPAPTPPPLSPPPLPSSSSSSCSHLLLLMLPQGTTHTLTRTGTHVCESYQNVGHIACAKKNTLRGDALCHVSAARHWDKLCTRHPGLYCFFLVTFSRCARWSARSVDSLSSPCGLGKCTFQGFGDEESSSKPSIRKSTG